MKEKILDFINTLTIYDYIYFISVVVIFIVLILLVLLLRKKLTLALFLLLIAILDISLGPTLGFEFFHNYLYKNKITITKAKKLKFLEAVVIEGVLKNQSKFDFKECKILVDLTKDTHNKYKNFILKLKPLKEKKITITNIKKNESKKFKILIEPFKYKKDFLVNINGVCKK
jgi:hypothetical protein